MGMIIMDAISRIKRATWITGGSQGNSTSVNSSYLATSSDPRVSWSLRTTPFTIIYPFSYSDHITSSFYANNSWVAVTYYGQIGASTSNNPQTPWTLKLNHVLNYSALMGIANGNGLWVAVGTVDTLYTSSDLNTWQSWTAVGPAADPGFGLHALVPGTMFGVKYGNGNWVVTGAGDGTPANGAISATTDPINGPWTFQRLATNYFYTIEYGNGLWVTAGTGADSSNYIYTATNPYGTWTRRASPFGADPFNNIYSIKYANGIWVAVGAGQTSYKVAWTSDPTGGWTLVSFSAISYPNALRSVDYGNGLWVAVSYNGNTFYSTDPTSGIWTAGATPPSSLSPLRLYTVTYGGY